MTFPLSTACLADLVDGRLTDPGYGLEIVTGGCIDSRNVVAHDCFFALPGERTHGVLFAEQAIARGAACVVTDCIRSAVLPSPTDIVRPSLAALDSAETDGRIIRVADAAVALQSLGRWNRQQSDALVVGVTGSVGKTTTRQMITRVLSSRFSGIQSYGNYNNELGVPLSLLQLNACHDFAVLELAASRIGEIAFLAEMIRPEFAVVTRVAAAHLESFGDLHAVRRTKAELPAAVGAGGTVFLNADDPAVLSMSHATAAQVVLFSTSHAADFRATSIQSRDGVCQFDVDGHPFYLHGGSHLITGAVAAIAIGRVAGLNPSEIADGLAEFRPDCGRGCIMQTQPWTVIDETYNASPASVQAAIQMLNDFVSARRRILVLGDMLELGPHSAHFHRDLGRVLQDSRVDHAILFGRYADHVASGAMEAGISPNCISVFRDLPTLLTVLDCVLDPGDVVLVKGSRSMQMERIVKAICRPDLPARQAA
jgi:UDP-N-acetylmuramoyl-tripeptide--D-alanyl-D-alanine ligase